MCRTDGCSSKYYIFNPTSTCRVRYDQLLFFYADVYMAIASADFLYPPPPLYPPPNTMVILGSPPFPEEDCVARSAHYTPLRLADFLYLPKIRKWKGRAMTLSRYANSFAEWRGP